MAHHSGSFGPTLSKIIVYFVVAVIALPLLSFALIFILLLFNVFIQPAILSFQLNLIPHTRVVRIFHDTAECISATLEVENQGEIHLLCLDRHPEATTIHISRIRDCMTINGPANIGTKHETGDLKNLSFASYKGVTENYDKIYKAAQESSNFTCKPEFEHFTDY